MDLFTREIVGWLVSTKHTTELVVEAFMDGAPSFWFSGYLGIKYRNFFLPTFTGKFLRMILIGLGTIQLIKLF